MATDLELLTLASNVYEDVEKEQSVTPFYADKNHTTEVSWKVVDSEGQDSPSGFFGAIYQKDKEIVIATRGTNDGTDWEQENLNTEWNTQQMKEAREMVINYIKTEVEKGTKLDELSIYFTGHSLGGKLAQQLLVEATKGLIEGLDSSVVKESPIFV